MTTRSIRSAASGPGPALLGLGIKPMKGKTAKTPSPKSKDGTKVAKKAKDPIKSTHHSGRGRPAGSQTKPPIAAKNPSRAAAEAGGKAMQRLFAMAAKMQVRANSEKDEVGEYTKVYLIVERNGKTRDVPSGNEKGGRPKTSDKEKDAPPHHSVKIFAPDGKSGFEAFRKDALRWGGRRGRANVEYMSDLTEVEALPPKKKSKVSEKGCAVK
jgi:hypothetical protein